MRKQKDGLQAVVEQWRTDIQEINKQKNIPSNQYMNRKLNLHSTEFEKNNNKEQENKINFEDIKQKDKKKVNENNKANKNYNNINLNESSDSEDGMSIFNESWSDNEQVDNINKNGNIKNKINFIKDKEQYNNNNDYSDEDSGESYDENDSLDN